MGGPGGGIQFLALDLDILIWAHPGLIWVGAGPGRNLRLPLVDGCVLFPVVSYLMGMPFSADGPPVGGSIRAYRSV
jgi:hypothetical protein